MIYHAFCISRYLLQLFLEARKFRLQKVLIRRIKQESAKSIVKFVKKCLELLPCNYGTGLICLNHSEKLIETYCKGRGRLQTRLYFQ